VNRAWNTTAHAIRHATALGLHLKLSTGLVGRLDYARRARLWWSLYRLEVYLSEITGRPKCIKGSDITVPYRNFFTEADEEATGQQSTHDTYLGDDEALQIWKAFLGDISLQANSTLEGGLIPWSRVSQVGFDTLESHFTSALDLSLISDDIGSTIWLSPQDMSWSDFQSTVNEHQTRLAEWDRSLPVGLQLSEIGQSSSDPRSVLELAMYANSVKMILYRPFLCEIRIQNESNDSMAFNRRGAGACVHAAMAMMDLMPNNPTAGLVLYILPWWSLLHYVSQAIAVLLLELCLNAQHMQSETLAIMNATQKSLHYLWALSPHSKSSHRAWSVARSLAERVAQRYQRSTLTDLPMEAPKPASWSNEDEAALQKLLLDYSHE
jgi:hypothetical protein